MPLQTNLSMRRGVRLRTILLIAVAFGVFLRVLAVVLQAAPESDGIVYSDMAASFASGKELLLPYIADPGPAFEPRLSHHFAPLWPIVLAGAYVVAGFSFAATMAASLFVSLLLLFVVFLTSRDLLGVEKAWLVTAVVALNFLLIGLTGFAYSENLLAVFYVGTIWAIIRSLKDERYVVLAGLLAGLGYLTKASVGYFFLLAGTMGFLWRFYYVRWKVFRDRYYMTAIVIFLAFVIGWAIRDALAFGWPNWETSPYTNQVVASALGRPLEFLPVFGAKIVLFLLFFGTLGLFFGPQVIRGLKQWRNEAVSALLLAITLPTILGLIFATAFTLFEPFAVVWWIDNLRYIVIAFVPLMWLALREESVPREFDLRLRLSSLTRLRFPTARSLLVRLSLVGVAAFAFYLVDRMVGLILLFGALFGPIPARRLPGIRIRSVLALLLALGLSSLNAATTVVHAPELEAAQFLAGVARDGDTIAVVGDADLFYMYPYLGNRPISFVQWNGSGNGTGARFVLTREPRNYVGYGLLATFNWTQTPGLVDSAYFWVSETARSILGLSIPRGPPVRGHLFLYRAGPLNIPNAPTEKTRADLRTVYCSPPASNGSFREVVPREEAAGDVSSALPDADLYVM